jgi:bifunctional DNA-binding transcriptional regulator/antitoxin component of YhaV-PrlF toxin-antitoxin module
VNVTAKLDRAGRLFLPLKIRRELGLDEKSELLIRVEEGTIRIQTREAAIREVQQRLRKYKRRGRSIVDEFSAERLQEARREWGKP